MVNMDWFSICSSFYSFVCGSKLSCKIIGEGLPSKKRPRGNENTTWCGALLLQLFLGLFVSFFFWGGGGGLWEGDGGVVLCSLHRGETKSRQALRQREGGEKGREKGINQKEKRERGGCIWPQQMQEGSKRVLILSKSLKEWEPCFLRSKHITVNSYIHICVVFKCACAFNLPP